MSSVSYSEKDKATLNALPLEEVMRMFEYEPDDTVKENTRIKYLCPFHDDHHASFSVSKGVPAGYDYQTYYCHVCKRGGHGALQLTQDLLRERGEATDNIQQEAIRRLTAHFHVQLEGKEAAEQHYAEFTDPDYCALNDRYTAHYSSTRSPQFSAGALKALGLPVNGSCASVLQDEFHCYELTECRYAAEGRLFRAWSTDERPLLEFDYGTHLRKYDPNCRSSYKNSYYRIADTDVDYDSQVYGDQTLLNLVQRFADRKARTVDAMREALAGHRPGYGLKDAKRLLPDPETGKMRMQDCKVLPHVVICSGQKDAINVYLRSTAHVIYPHSETSYKGLSRQFIETLLFLADRVYVLFDADKAGQTAQNNLCLRHLELHPVKLPADLSLLKNPVTGKPCKDITEFFTQYCPKHRIEPEFRFKQMLSQAKDLRFWNTKAQKHHGTEPGEWEYGEAYTLDAMSLARFLEANGFYGVWEKDANGVEYVQSYMHVGPYHCQDFELLPNVCRIITLDKGFDYAKQIIRNFFHGYDLSPEESEGLENAILTQKRVGDSGLRNAIGHAALDIFYWTPTRHREADRSGWLFFRNKAVRITADGVEMVAYRDLNFLVNEAVIADFDILPQQEALMQQFLHFRENPEYAERKAGFDTEVRLRTKSAEQLTQMSKEFARYQRLWRFIQDGDRHVGSECMPIVQLAHNQSRIYWAKEEQNYTITPEERQMQFIYELNLMNALGYLLYRYRTKAQVHFVLFTDYKVSNEKNAEGGTGKSTWNDLLNLVCPRILLKGKQLKTGDAWPKNFENYVHGRHALICIDDWSERIKGSELNGMEDGLDVRAIYQNTVHIPFEVMPKILVTTNQLRFDVTERSTYRRLYLVPFSDWFMSGDSDGSRPKRTYMTEFGHNIITEASPDELNAIGWFFILCLQTYLRIGEPLEIPYDETMLSRTASASIKSGDFRKWAETYFSQDCHFCRPIAVSEMQLSYAQWINCSLRKDVVEAGLSQFLTDLYTYAKAGGFTILGRESEIVRGKYAGNARFVPRNCWTTPIDEHDTYRPDRPRVVRQVGCLYLFRPGDKIPLRGADLKKCGKEDPEAQSDQ